MKIFHIEGVLMYDDNNNPFPHDGEEKPGHSCTGYGCDCDEKNRLSFGEWIIWWRR